MDGTRQTIDGRDALRFERHLDHSVERVWRAVTEPAELARWFVAVVDWKPELGEVFEAAGQRGQVTELDEPHTIAWTWSEERYRFELSPEGDGCMLVFTHVFTEEWGPAWQHAAGWEAYFNRLDAHLAGGFLSEEDVHEGFPELLERYKANFGSASA
jgi:uncharacterized protein YndB with AHSA1/START domain